MFANLQTAHMEMSGLLEAAALMRVVLRSVSTGTGARCVMMPGRRLMLRWSADSSAIPPLVRYHQTFVNCILHIIFVKPLTIINLAHAGARLQYS